MLFRRRLRKKEEWTRILSGPLTWEQYERLSRGKLRRKGDYREVRDKILGCVIGNIDKVMSSFGGEMQDTEAVFRLREIRGELEKLLFFRNVKFLKQEDSENLELVVRDAVREFVRQVSEQVRYESADIARELNDIENTIRVNE